MQNKTVYYAEIIEYDESIRDVIGGCPRHVPMSIPVSDMTGEELVFYAEISSASIPGVIDDLDGIQIFGPKDLDEPQRIPVVVPVFKGANINKYGRGNKVSPISQRSILWRKDVEPEEIRHNIPSAPGDLKCYSFKMGGGRFLGIGTDCSTPIGFLVEGDEGFNFGGSIVILRESGVFFCEPL